VIVELWMEMPGDADERLACEVPAGTYTIPSFGLRDMYSRATFIFAQ
jgi:hypothetical protein